MLGPLLTEAALLPCTPVTRAPKPDKIWALDFKRWPALTCRSVAPLGMTLWREEGEKLLSGGGLGRHSPRQT